MKRMRLIPAAVLLLALCACKQTVSEAPSVTEEPSSEKQYIVRADWSRLEEKDGLLPAVGSRWYDGYVDCLIPGEDYGFLVPYAGVRMAEDWPAQSGCMYGLMTTGGVAVTAPVFSQITAPVYYDGAAGGFETHPLLVLMRHDPADETGSAKQYAIAAQDGSWCTEFQYDGVVSSASGLLLLEADRLSIMSPTGELLETYSPEDLGLTREEWQSASGGVDWGESPLSWEGDDILLNWADDTCESVKIFQQSTRRTVTVSYGDWLTSQSLSGQGSPWDSRYDYDTRETVITYNGSTCRIPHALESGDTVSVEGGLVFINGDRSCDVYDLDGKEILSVDNGRIEYVRDQILGANAPGILAIVSYEEGQDTITYCRTDGSRIAAADNWQGTLYEPWYRRVTLVGGLLELLDLNTAAYYDMDTEECVFRTYLGYEPG